MDAVFAILVLGAVIFFGALISAGNECQRKALEGIREQTAQWAMQDLRLKREKLARDVKVDDPVAWLNQIAAKVYGKNLDLSVSESFNNPQVLVCISKDGKKLAFSPVSPGEIHRMYSAHKNKLMRIGNTNPLWALPKKAIHNEASILNSGLYFDLELSIVWESQAGFSCGSLERLWTYEIS